MGNQLLLSNFIERTYEAALDHTVWDTLLADLSHFLHSEWGALLDCTPVLRQRN